MKLLIEHVNVFDGYHEALTENASIVVEDGMVREILQGPVGHENFAQVIDGGGRTAMPGMADSHAHLGMSAPQGKFESLRMDELAIRSTRFAREMLERGFTTVRDAGGVVYGLKATIDEGFIPGPRIFASQIKLMTGGGLSSKFDHLFTAQYTFEELKAAVDCASDYGTYVMAHIYTPACMQRAARAGVKSFEHGTLMDEETARIIQDKGIWVCPGPQFGSSVRRAGTGVPKASGHQIPIETMMAAEEQSTELINRFDLSIVFGTDASDDPDYVAKRQHGDISLFKKRFGSLKTLRALTGNVYELGKLCTYQHPYPDGKLGVLEAGSYADLLLVKGNPVEDVDILADIDNIQLVMKGGVIYKNNI